MAVVAVVAVVAEAAEAAEVDVVAAHPVVASCRPEVAAVRPRRECGVRVPRDVVSNAVHAARPLRF